MPGKRYHSSSSSGEGSDGEMAPHRRTPRGLSKRGRARSLENPISVRDRPGTSGLSRHRPATHSTPGQASHVAGPYDTLSFVDYRQPKQIYTSMESLNSNASEASSLGVKRRCSFFECKAVGSLCRKMSRDWFSESNIVSVPTESEESDIMPSMGSTYDLSLSWGKSGSEDTDLSSLSSASSLDKFFKRYSMKRRASTQIAPDDAKKYKYSSHSSDESE